MLLFHTCSSSIEHLEIVYEDALVKMANVFFQKYFTTKSYTIGVSHFVMDNANENLQNGVLNKVLNIIEPDVAVRFERVKNKLKPVQNEHNLVLVDCVESFRWVLCTWCIVNV